MCTRRRGGAENCKSAALVFSAFSASPREHSRFHAYGHSPGGRRPGPCWPPWRVPRKGPGGLPTMVKVPSMAPAAMRPLKGPSSEVQPRVDGAGDGNGDAGGGGAVGG